MTDLQIIGHGIRLMTKYISPIKISPQISPIKISPQISPIRRIKYKPKLNFKIQPKPIQLKPIRPNPIEPNPIEPNPIKKNFAIIFGISDYLNINDLSYCDDDIVVWYQILKSLGYDVSILSDPTNKSQIARKIGLLKSDIQTATEINIYMTMKQIYQNMSNIINSDPNKNSTEYKFIYISSGHGDTYNKINGSFIYTYDDYNTIYPMGPTYTTSDNKINDYELKKILKTFTDTNIHVITIMDNCHTGGFIGDLLDINKNNLMTIITASKFLGYGYDLDDKQHGALTYYLTKNLKSNNYNLRNTFKSALNDYIKEKKPDKNDYFQIGGNQDIGL